VLGYVPNSRIEKFETLWKLIERLVGFCVGEKRIDRTFIVVIFN
jgi:hypothetical protein